LSTRCSMLTSREFINVMARDRLLLLVLFS
jgi:hypothetical protein